MALSIITSTFSKSGEPYFEIVDTATGCVKGTFSEPEDACAKLCELEDRLAQGYSIDDEVDYIDFDADDGVADDGDDYADCWDQQPDDVNEGESPSYIDGYMPARWYSRTEEGKAIVAMGKAVPGDWDYVDPAGKEEMPF